MSKKVERDFAITLSGIAKDTLETMLLKAGAFIEALRNYCIKNNYSINLIFVVSVHKSSFAIKLKEETGKAGRPRTYFYEPNNKRFITECKPHIHMLITAYPGRTISGFIKEYWKQRNGEYSYYFKNVTYWDGFLDYMDKQGSYKRRMNINYFQKAQGE